MFDNQRLSGLDATFLYLETPSTPMHTMAVLLLGKRQPSLSIRSIESLFLDRMHHLPALRQRVIDVPLGLDHPVLVDDPDFDIRHHVKRVHWDEPGTLEDVDWAVSVLASRRLDRGRPLWQAFWFDHLAEGGSALVVKVHHAIVDGVSSAIFMAQLLDSSPVFPPVRCESAHPPTPPPPTASTLALQAVLNQTRRSAAAARGVIGLAGRIQRSRGIDGQEGKRSGELRSWSDRFSPPTSLNGSLSTRRTISRTSASFEDFRHVKRAFDATINDVLLAVVTLALGRHFAAHGGAPHRPLKAAIPVSTRCDGDGIGGNHVSILLVSLPVHLSRPQEVIRAIRLRTRSAKNTHESLPSGFMENALEFVPPLALKWIARQHDRLNLADFYPPLCNLIISNFPGPPVPLYCAGAPVRAAYPFGPLMNGSGLNLTVMSYNGRMDLGLIACPQRMPQARGFVSDLDAAVAILREASGEINRPVKPALRRPIARSVRRVPLGSERAGSVSIQ